jgi:hypothetical protein
MRIQQQGTTRNLAELQGGDSFAVQSTVAQKSRDVRDSRGQGGNDAKGDDSCESNTLIDGAEKHLSDMHNGRTNRGGGEQTNMNGLSGPKQSSEAAQIQTGNGTVANLDSTS